LSDGDTADEQRGKRDGRNGGFHGWHPHHFVLALYRLAT
jgi:hypothetical protein